MLLFCNTQYGNMLQQLCWFCIQFVFNSANCIDNDYRRVYNLYL